MYKLIIFFIFFFLVAACKPQLKNKTNSEKKLPKLSQGVSNCAIPLNVTSDSLFNFVYMTTLKRGIELGFKSSMYSDSILSANFYNSIPKDLQNNFIKECQLYLIKKLGVNLFCNNLHLTLNSYVIDKGIDMDRRTLTFFFTMPGIISRKPNIWTGKNLEVAEFKFSLICHGRDKGKIIYPENVPDCENRLDCGYTITKDSAIQTAIANRFISETSKYLIRTDGTYWMLFVDNQELNYTRMLKIHMQTGVFIEKNIHPNNDVMNK